MNNVNPKQLMLLGGLVIAVIGVFIYQFGGMGGGSATPAPGAKPGAKATPSVERFKEVDVNIDELLEGIKAVNFDYASSRISRDPMTPLVGQLTDDPAMQAEQGVRPGQNRMEIFMKKITGIVWDQYDPRAVIDNEVVGIGYTYPSGVQIYDIKEKRVTFKDGDSLIHRDLEESGS